MFFKCIENEKIVIESQPEEIPLYIKLLLIRHNLIAFILFVLISGSSILSISINLISNYTAFDIIISIATFVLIIFISIIIYMVTNKYYKNIKYILTNKRLIIVSGFMNIRIHNIDLDTILDIDKSINFYEKSNNLASLHLSTYGNQGTRELGYNLIFLKDHSNFEKLLRTLVADARKSGRNVTHLI